MSTTPTATPPAWLEAAAKLDALVGEKLSPFAGRDHSPAEEEIEEQADRAHESESPPEPVMQSVRLESRLSINAIEAKEHPRITPPAVVLPGATPTEDTELAWHGYSAAALVPSTIALAALTCSAIVVLRPLVPAWVIHEAADAPLAALWLLQAVRAGYRLFAYNYRLTSRRLIRDLGRLYPRDEPLDLATVVRAEVRQSLFGRLTNVGSVRVIPEEATPSKLVVELAGVRRPKAFAARIEAAAAAAREANVTMGRATEPNRAAALPS
jgi:hypothetical protein